MKRRNAEIPVTGESKRTAHREKRVRKTLVSGFSNIREQERNSGKSK